MAIKVGVFECLDIGGGGLDDGSCGFAVCSGVVAAVCAIFSALGRRSNRGAIENFPTRTILTNYSTSFCGFADKQGILVTVIPRTTRLKPTARFSGGIALTTAGVAAAGFTSCVNGPRLCALVCYTFL